MARKICYSIGGVCLVLIISIFIFASVAAAAGFTGNDWAKLRNAQKVNEVKSFISSLGAQGVTIKGNPVTYCKKLDEFYASNPELKKEQVAATLKTLIVMEYDWEIKGADKDATARQWLGADLYKKNKERIGR